MLGPLMQKKNPTTDSSDQSNRKTEETYFKVYTFCLSNLKKIKCCTHETP